MRKITQKIKLKLKKKSVRKKLNIRDEINQVGEKMEKN